MHSDFDKTIREKVRAKAPNWTPPDSLYLAIEERLNTSIGVFVAKNIDDVIHASMLDSLGLKPAQVTKRRKNRQPDAKLNSSTDQPPGKKQITPKSSC